MFKHYENKKVRLLAAQVTMENLKEIIVYLSVNYTLDSVLIDLPKSNSKEIHFILKVDKMSYFLNLGDYIFRKLDSPTLCICDEETFEEQYKEYTPFKCSEKN